MRATMIPGPLAAYGLGPTVSWDESEPETAVRYETPSDSPRIEADGTLRRSVSAKIANFARTS